MTRRRNSRFRTLARSRCRGIGSSILALALILAAVPFAATEARAQADIWKAVKIEPVEVGGTVTMFTGRGGNLAVSIGDDGVFLVDDQFAPLADKISAAIAELTDQPVRFLLNTHWHGDHTGGNAAFAGKGAILVAHANVRQRMSTEQFNEVFNRTTPASPDEALPVVTFENDITFHYNGETIHVFHVNDAHTDGDAIVHFRDANAIHMGDCYFNGMYPFIDLSSGGNVDGVIAAANQVLEIAGNDTKIIPGHGPLSGVTELREYRDMLVAMRKKIHGMVEQGRTQGQIIAAKPSADYDEKWGGGFMQPDVWVGIVAKSLGAK